MSAVTTGTTAERKVEDRRAIWSWCFYDFANSPFTTLVVTFVFSTYFARSIVGDPIYGSVLWMRGISATAILVALASPFMGALADRGGYRKRLLFASTVLTVLGSVALFFVGPGQIMTALIFFVVANVAFEVGLVFYNAFLPDIAPADKIGRISGYGWGLGYAGGLLALVVALVGLVQPEVPWFGFSKEGGEAIRATNLLVAIWFAVFSVPIFLWVREDKSKITTSGSILKATTQQLVDTFREIQKYRQVVRFLLARLFFNDGLVTVFAFGGLYAAGTFGFSETEILVFAIALNLAAGTGAFVMGVLDDKLGGKRTIEISLWALLLATILAVLAPNRIVFWISGILLGIFSGPNQAASRSLMARFVPPDKENEFFGFFAFSGKATAFMGPFLLGVMIQLFDFQTSFNPQRAGVSVVIVFFVVGMLLLRGVDEAEGIKTAARN
jgi:UMF1 family MFS transporter